ncbi:MAG: prolyl oligopeptidase family serine peptidase [Gammaproteobacteria bacterium]|nr:prolyl oligopeptidase family serine peptidase [Gammaproteobacteria bacterium]
MRKLIGILLFTLLIPVSEAKLVTKVVHYQEGDTKLKGFLAYDTKFKGKRPGVLVVHEWWGQNAYARKRAEMLAKLGYVAFALDMYGNGKTATHPKDAGKFAGMVSSNMPLAKARFLAALDQLKANPLVEPDKIAAIGYCFGGGIVLQMARQGVDLKGVASFHGSLGTKEPAKPGEVKAKIMVFNGEADPFTTAAQIEAFKKEMQDAGADYQFINYPGAKHSFTNPDATALGKKFDLPLAYNAKADKDSWAKMQAFFKEIFK